MKHQELNRFHLHLGSIPEWHESATALASPELAAAFNAETDEVPLTKPSAGSAA
ncbi:hypothetical protein [Nostoc sp. UHCC 0251]|uniref:hypothetical protein n=1 Tax=Nostoc sp. UHCC 0251 TaxID=3110240 RepID=UPI002B2065E8|nr:hypothetical protein [Nostoc sp. UHCC 0251]MEA5625775.1 hypothetical protein [Nostoc sp. UHCC 0251]